MSAISASHEVTGSRLINSALLLGVLACCLALPRIVTEPFGVNLPGFPPYLPAGAVLWAPLIAMVVLANGYLASGGRGLIVRLEDTDLAFTACLAIWLLLEFTHSVRAAVEPDLDLILQLAWLQVFYLAICSFRHTPLVRRWVTRQSILLITAGCVIQLFALLQITPSAIAPFEPFRERPEYSFVNQAAFLAAFGVTLVYFFSDLRRQSVGWQVLLHGCAIVDLVFLLMSQSRGATVVLGSAIFVGLMGKLPPRVIRRIVVLFAVLTVIGLVALRPDFTRLAELGLYNRSFTEGGGMRLEMIQVGAGTFVDAPLGGVGLRQANRQRVDGFQVHTSYVLVLMAYGLCGALALLFLIRAFRPSREGVATITVATATVMLMGSMTFLPNLPWWYAVLGFVVREARGQPEVD